MSNYKNYHYTEYIDNSIQRKDLLGVRDQLCTTIKYDPTFSTSAFQDGVEYVESVRGVKDLWQVYDSKRAELYGNRVDQGDPTLCEKDFTKAVFYLSRNFCSERLEDVKKLGKFLYKDDAKNKVASVKTTSDTSHEQTSKRPPEPAVKFPLLPVIMGVGMLIATVVILIQVVQNQ